MSFDIGNSFVLNMGDIIALANAFKPSQWETVLVAILPAYISAFVTLYLYIIQRRDKHRDAKIEQDTEKILDLNLLLMNLFQCIENQKANLSEVQEYKNKTKENYKERTRYVFKTGCNIEDIIRISNKLIGDLPEVSYELNKLQNDLFWAQRYREQRDSRDDGDYYDFYQERLKLEEGQEIIIIKKLVVICLVVYDYATNLFPKKRILKITEKTHIAKIWEYLIDDKNFNEKNVFGKLQYEFKNVAIKEWFFGRLKKQYVKDNQKKRLKNK